MMSLTNTHTPTHAESTLIAIHALLQRANLIHGDTPTTQLPETICRLIRRLEAAKDRPFIIFPN